MTAWTCRQFAGKAAQKIVPRRPRNPCWKGLRADSEEKREPVSDIDPGVVNSLKALDPERPIREAVVAARQTHACIQRRDVGARTTPNIRKEGVS